MSETEIQAQILRALKAAHIQAWRTNATARSYRMASNPGFPDIVAILPGGTFLGIEVKTAAGKLRPEQEAFAAVVRKAGGRYVVARSLDDVMPYLQGRWA